MTDSEYQDIINNWRDDMEAGLLRENNWLDLVSLHWLDKGETTFGSSPDNKIILPHGSGPMHIGTFAVKDDGVTADLFPDAAVTVEDRPVSGQIPLKADVTGEPTILKTGTLTLMLIERGEMLGIRVWDTDSPTRKSFTGREWHPVQEDYRLTAGFTLFPEPKSIIIPDITGNPNETEFIGEVTFEIDGDRVVGEVMELDSGALYLIFKDATSGKSAYPAARYLVTEVPEGNTVVIDFNKAYNPPCAFTAYATCPLPSPRNMFSVAIEAGEKYSS